MCVSRILIIMTKKGPSGSLTVQRSLYSNSALDAAGIHLFLHTQQLIARLSSQHVVSFLLPRGDESLSWKDLTFQQPWEASNVSAFKNSLSIITVYLLIFMSMPIPAWLTDGVCIFALQLESLLISDHGFQELGQWGNMFILLDYSSFIIPLSLDIPDGCTTF